jgi:hypothetical protein
VRSLDDQLATIDAMSAIEVKAEWVRIHRRPAPAVSSDLLSRSIAYKLQERAHGGLDSGTRRELQRLMRRFARTGDVSDGERIAIKPGTRLVREWHGRTYQVLVIDDGYVFEDRRYRSLSQIANSITGANWSGPRFFGLTSRRSFAGLETERG